MSQTPYAVFPSPQILLTYSSTLQSTHTRDTCAHTHTGSIVIILWEERHTSLQWENNISMVLNLEVLSQGIDHSRNTYWRNIYIYVHLDITRNGVVDGKKRNERSKGTTHDLHPSGLHCGWGRAGNTLIQVHLKWGWMVIGFSEQMSLWMLSEGKWLSRLCVTIGTRRPRSPKCLLGVHALVA